MQELFLLFNQYAKSELMVLVPVLYLVNQMIYKSAIKDERIPMITSIISIALCMIYTFSAMQIEHWKAILMAVFTSITQGIIYAGASIFWDILVNPCSISKIMCKNKNKKNK